MVTPITTIRASEPQEQPARRGRQDIAHMRRMARLSARRRRALALIRRADAAPPLRPDEAAEILLDLAICLSSNAGYLIVHGKTVHGPDGRPVRITGGQGRITGSKGNGHARSW